jgi:uncharacterized membrane protein YeaQ/YmgE (transglycosylase-associated protein family)
MGLLLTLIIGALAGWLAGVLMRGGGYGLIADIIIGIIGAVIGRWLFGLLGFHVVGVLGALITATVGAVVLIAIVRAIKRA